MSAYLFFWFLCSFGSRSKRPRALQLLIKMLIRLCLMREGLVLSYWNFLFNSSQWPSSLSPPQHTNILLLWHKQETLSEFDRAFNIITLICKCNHTLCLLSMQNKAVCVFTQWQMSITTCVALQNMCWSMTIVNGRIKTLMGVTRSNILSSCFKWEVSGNQDKITYYLWQ